MFYFSKVNVKLRQRSWLKNWRLFLTVVLLLLTAAGALFLLAQKTFHLLHKPIADRFQLPACIFPRLNPFDPSIERFVSHPRTIHCNKVHRDLVTLDGDGYIHFHGLGTREWRLGKMQCFYRGFSGTLEPKRKELVFDLWAPIKQSPQLIVEDQFEVRCYERNKTAFGTFIAPPKNDSTAYEDLVEIYRNAFLQVVPRSKNFAPAGRDRYSIDLMVLESISWNQFRRHFPMSWHYMRTAMGFIFLENHGKADDNTLVNMIPVLTGKRFSEYPKQDHVHNDIDAKYPLDSDKDIPFLWKNYSQEGCVTFFNDDPCHPSRGFSFYPRSLMHGFSRPPTDHYYRAGHMYHRLLSYAHENFAANQSKHCRGNVPYHKLVLDLSRQFMEKYARTCRFSVTSSLHETMHDFVTHPEMVDEDLRDFLDRLHKGAAMENSILIVMGDHGHRMQGIKHTYVGQIEERTSMVSFWFPPSFRQSYPRLVEMVRSNAERLTNHFDIYETMRDVFEDRLEELERRGARLQVERLNGQSLFQPISRDRTCPEAGILPQFCVCLEKVGELTPMLNLSSKMLEPLGKWLKKEGLKVEPVAELIEGGVYSTNQLVQHSLRHLHEAGIRRNETFIDGDIEFVEFIARLSSGRKIRAQIQHTKKRGGRSELFSLVEIPVLSPLPNL